MIINIVGGLRERFVAERRASVLCSQLSALLPRDASILDVGCGDGFLASQIMRQRDDLQLQGIDVLMRPKIYIPIQEFDGINISLEDNSVDVVMFVDVLHHTEDPNVLLQEACRVARQAVVLKDHLRNGFLAHTTLRFMDWVGNAHHGVALPYNYWSRQEWMRAFDDLKLSIDEWEDSFQLYSLPTNWLFGRDLHFAARLGLPTAEDTLRSNSCGSTMPAKRQPVWPGKRFDTSEFAEVREF
ncbi:MAG: SAM-dependent methyltransferase [Planctomycetaceae bacterium]|nr:SAM-dependent methyltransferase [Planctomycetaceae bacterium]